MLVRRSLTWFSNIIEQNRDKYFIIFQMGILFFGWQIINSRGASRTGQSERACETLLTKTHTCSDKCPLRSGSYGSCGWVGHKPPQVSPHWPVLCISHPLDLPRPSPGRQHTLPETFQSSSLVFRYAVATPKSIDSSESYVFCTTFKV